MVSDNASIFTGDTFLNYCLENRIRQNFIAPGHAATNRLAERNVQTLKNKLKSMINENYLNRQISIKFDAMRPYQGRKVPTANSTAYTMSSSRRKSSSKSFISNKPFWKNGTIKQKLGNLHYIIELDEGKSLNVT
ncbi:hypothetical protein LAZ67_10001883 [Cordylochernes scorpioides]|uniref:Integrase catalytic domain-containing protein n=1 Tax=Cordylochernes scorpioides TaxID=51811 RepID=A0ABY6KW71_9ARAC|nr:hypothetical protein LAZ67_10001883 [Cordylochernes scorpioides]